ncbi:MAG: hypothetical protein V1495_00610 [Pseudomonadota bacterium]
MQPEKSYLWCLGALTALSILLSNIASAQQLIPKGPCLFPKDKTARDLEKANYPGCYQLFDEKVKWITQQPRVILPGGGTTTLPTGRWTTPSPYGTGYGGDVGTYVYLFKEFWAFLKENKPVSKTDLPFTSVLPFEMKNVESEADAKKQWEQMVGWSKLPKSVGFGLLMENFYGIDVVRIDYAIRFFYGGHLKDKGGKYLMNVRVVPEQISVMPGFEASFDSKVEDIINFATEEKPDEPVAGISLYVHWDVESILASRQGSRSFVISGDGGFWEVTSSPMAIKAGPKTPIMAW